MGFTMPHVLTVAATGVVLLALLLQIVGLATTSWVIISFRNLEMGLWKFCNTGSLGKCINYPHVSGRLEACRAFGVLGVLAMLGSVGVSVLSCVLSGHRVLSLLAPIAALAGALCALLEFAIFAWDNSSADFGFSFALTIVACVLAGLSAILFFLGRSRTAPAPQ